MKIFIKTLQGKTTELEINENATVADLKKEIEEKFNVEQDCQRILCKGSFMADAGKKLADHKLEDGSSVTLIIYKVSLMLYA